MDELTKYNIARWKALVEADALFTRPALSLNPGSARHMLDPEGRLGDLASKDVLCLACGGGKQSIAFALLNANVTVFDLSEAQLNRDREAATHCNVEIKIVRGDIQDLSHLEAAAFDIVYHGYSLGFVPNARIVFQQGGACFTPRWSIPFYVRESILFGNAGKRLEWRRIYD